MFQGEYFPKIFNRVSKYFGLPNKRTCAFIYFPKKNRTNLPCAFLWLIPALCVYLVLCIYLIYQSTYYQVQKVVELIKWLFLESGSAICRFLGCDVAEPCGQVRQIKIKYSYQLEVKSIGSPSYWACSSVWHERIFHKEYGHTGYVPCLATVHGWTGRDLRREKRRIDFARGLCSRGCPTS